jgi:hypothetical protein
LPVGGHTAEFVTKPSLAPRVANALVVLVANTVLAASSCGSKPDARPHAAAPTAGVETTNTTGGAAAAPTVTTAIRAAAKGTTSTTKPRAQAKSSASGGSSTVPPLPGTRLPDVVTVTHMATDFPGIRFKESHATTWVLQRTVEGAMTHLRWTQQGGDPTRYFQRDLVAGPADVRGLFQTPDGGGGEDCVWDGQPLLRVPLHPAVGQSFSETASCHSKSTVFAFKQQVQVKGPVTVKVDGQDRQAWSLHRAVDATLTGDRKLTDHSEGDETWVLDGPLLVQASIHSTVDSPMGVSNVQSDFNLDHFVRP